VSGKYFMRREILSKKRIFEAENGRALEFQAKAHK
jgi:hypothetical protein